MDGLPDCNYNLVSVMNQIVYKHGHVKPSSPLQLGIVQCDLDLSPVANLCINLQDDIETKFVYAPGLKGLPGASSNQIVCLSVSPSVRNSVPLTNKLQYLKFGW